MNNYLVFMPEEMYQLTYPIFKPGFYKFEQKEELIKYNY